MSLKQAGPHGVVHTKIGKGMPVMDSKARRRAGVLVGIGAILLLAAAPAVSAHETATENSDGSVVFADDWADAQAQDVQGAQDAQDSSGDLNAQVDQADTGSTDATDAADANDVEDATGTDSTDATDSGDSNGDSGGHSGSGD